ncbi:MAG: large-conductance mechanosensitive channel protein MscL [Candidatus Kapabacteria bacterium]|nr:large-conductance mechanosensitive channel protein MscL [Candidatus Kapabacteria bacterium]
MVTEFKEFISKGNVLDLAIGVVVGVAFGAITASLVNDIIMPPVGMILGGVNFADIATTLKPADADGKGAVLILWGKFFQVVLNFLIIAFVMFLIVKGVNAMKRKQVAAPVAPAGPSEIQLLTEIRDGLRNRG